MAMAALPLALLVAASGLARVRAQGEIRWAGDLQGGEPYVFRDPRDPSKLVGFEVELVRALASKLGLGERFVQNDWSNLVPSLERGDFDLIVNGLEDTQALRGRILLSRPYFNFAEQLVVRRGSTLRSLDALRGHRVHPRLFAGAPDPARPTWDRDRPLRRPGGALSRSRAAPDGRGAAGLDHRHPLRAQQAGPGARGRGRRARVIRDRAAQG